MANLRVQSKYNGLKALKGSWIKAIIIMLIIGLLYFGVSKLEDAYRNILGIQDISDSGLPNITPLSLLISLCFTAILFLIMSPLILGMTEWYWNMTNGEPSEIGDIFGWYGSLKLYGKSLLLRINVGVRKLLWGLITCGIPAAIVAAGEYYLLKVNTNSRTLSGTDMQNLLFGGILAFFGATLMLGGIFLYVYIISRYILANFLLVEDNSRKIGNVVRDSIKYTKTYRWELTKFVLSFAGWFISCIAILPALYVIPYFSSSITVYSKHIIYEKRHIYEKIDADRDDHGNSGNTAG